VAQGALATIESPGESPLGSYLNNLVSGMTAAIGQQHNEHMFNIECLAVEPFHCQATEELTLEEFICS
jgi:hypothetical protein